MLPNFSGKYTQYWKAIKSNTIVARNDIKENTLLSFIELYFVLSMYAFYLKIENISL